MGDGEGGGEGVKVAEGDGGVGWEVGVLGGKSGGHVGWLAVMGCEGVEMLHLGGFAVGWTPALFISCEVYPAKW